MNIYKMGFGVFSVLTFVIMGFGCGSLPDEKAQKIALLEEHAQVYIAQIDSMDTVVDGLNGRITSLSSQVDSSRSVNKTLVTTLQKITDSMREYRRLFEEQKAQNQGLQKEVAAVKKQRDKTMIDAMILAGKVDSLDGVLITQRNRIARLEGSLRNALDREALAQKAVSMVFVYSGTLKELQKQGYLEVRQQTILTDTYHLIGFPPVADTRVKRVAIGDKLDVTGQVRFVVDRHGKLKAGKSYKISDRESNKPGLTFEEEIMQGQRVLVVLK